MNRESLLLGLKKAIEHRREEDQAILLVAHFAETFSQVQTKLEQWGIDHEIVTQPVDRAWISNLRSDQVTPVYLTLAEMLRIEDVRDRGNDNSLSLAMMVCERHPLVTQDELIEQFAKQTPIPVELGYFVALDDAVMKQFINDSILTLLRQMGMTDHALITSNLISKRLRNSLQRHAKMAKSNRAADSAEQWIELNLPKASEAD